MRVYGIGFVYSFNSLMLKHDFTVFYNIVKYITKRTFTLVIFYFYKYIFLEIHERK